jgi:hypothetical protein
VAEKTSARNVVVPVFLESEPGGSLSFFYGEGRVKPRRVIRTDVEVCDPDMDLQAPQLPFWRRRSPFRAKINFSFDRHAVADRRFMMCDFALAFWIIFA